MLTLLQQLFGGKRAGPVVPALIAPPIPDYLADLLDRVAAEKQRLTWEAAQAYAIASGLPLEQVVARTWGQRFPFVELLDAGLPQSALAWYERDWSRQSTKQQTRLLSEAFACAAATTKHQRALRH